MEEKYKKIFEFLKFAGKLKTTYRYSHTKNFPRDSAADHSWRLSLMAMLFSKDLDMDSNKLIRLSLVHDLAEALTGDIDMYLIVDGIVSKEQKAEAEKKAIEEMCSKLPDEEAAEIRALWNEYEDAQTKEAIFIKTLDKIETIIHMIEAGHEAQDRPNITGFYGNDVAKKCPELASLWKYTKKELRKEFEKGNLEWNPEFDG